MKGVILAGGKGTRLRPLTCNLPKPMLPLLNKPVMEYSIELLKRHGIEEIAVTVQYMSSAIKNYFGDGSRWGVKLHYFEDSPPLGTAGSMKQAEHFLNEPFVVISGDAVTDFDLSRGIDYHNSGDRLVTIFLKEVATPLDFGLVVAKDDGKITKYIEKPSWHEVVSNTVNTGIYVMHPDIFSYMKCDTFYDFSHDIFPQLLERDERMYSYLFDGYWLDIGTFPQYRQAHLDLLTKKVNVPQQHTEILPSVWMGKDVKVEEGVQIHGPVLIGDGACIKAGAVIEPYSVIGKYTVIGENTHICTTILGNDIYVGKQCELIGTTVAYGTVIEDGATCFEKSIIADHCKVGRNTVIKSKVKVWPGKVMASSSVINSSIITGYESAVSVLKRGKAIGTANRDMNPEFAAKLAAAYGSTLPIHSTVLIGSDHHIYSQLLKNVFMSALHAVGIHTIECQEISEACFRYAIAAERVDGGVFLYGKGNAQREHMVIRFYDEKGRTISTRAEKEVETAYASETHRYADVANIGCNTNVSVCEDQYVHAILKGLNVSIIQKEQLHILVNRVNSPFHANVLLFLQQLGCTVTWVYSSGNESHVKSIMQSSGVDVALIFSEQGDTFELYDLFGHIYTSIEQEHVALPEVLLSKGNGAVYPLYVRNGTSYVVCYAQEQNAAALPGRFHHDVLFRIGKLLELIALQQLPLHMIFEHYPQFHLVWDEVLCPWKEKGRVMRMLMDDFQQAELEILEGIKFQHENGDWSYIVSDVNEPRLLIYSQSLNAAIAKEKIMYLAEKIRQYQKV